MKTNYSTKLIKGILRILPVAFWLTLIFAFDKTYIAALTLLCALIHELGHILGLLLLRKQFRFFGVCSGFRLSIRSSLSYKEELTVALFGPLINIVLFLILYPFFNSSEYLNFFALINLFTAISNLIPIESFDGYRIAECIINQYCTPRIFASLLRVISFSFSAILCLTALYLIRSFNGGYWVFFIFLASLVKAISRDTSVIL